MTCRHTWLFGLLVACLIGLPATSLAQTGNEPDRRSHLRLKTDFWSSSGLAVVKGGTETELGLFYDELYDLVDGEAAKTHARRATIYSIASLTSALISIGLMSADFLIYTTTRGTPSGWPDLVPRPGGGPSLFLGFLAAMTSTAVFGYLSYAELAVSISLHNADLPLDSRASAPSSREFGPSVGLNIRF